MRSPFAGFVPRRRFVRALAVTVALGMAALAVAGRAQELRLPGLDGQTLTDADLRQGNVVVVVWASWSPRSRGIAERIDALAAGGKARVLTVNFQEDRPVVEAFLANNRFRAPVYLDGDGAFAKRYALANLPGLLVLKNGTVAYQGKLPDDPAPLLRDLLP